MVEASLASVTLSDKYTLDHGRILLSGRQALVRLALLQRRLDRARGLNTAGFISGYRGSPLGTYDLELQRAGRLLEEHDIVFRPGLNEDSAATAIWGTQQLDFVPGRKVQGVFSIWYGKGPGVDRSGDPFKHANLAGTEPYGGVLLAFGDDHAAKSSTTAHQSDLSLAALDIPVLYPANVAEILDFGLAGIELSRFSGLLVGLKIVNETADGASTVAVDATRDHFIHPEVSGPPGGVNIRKEFLARQEQDARVVRYKLPRAQAFARANALDRLVFGATRPKLLIVTAGKAYADVVAALELLGIDAAHAHQIGLGVYKVGMIYPLEPLGLREVAQQADEVLCVEEKRPQIERQAASALFNIAHHPRLTGKFEPDGTALLPADVPLDPLAVAQALARRLGASIADLERRLPGLAARSKAIATQLERAATGSVGPLTRDPAFCPGCPHNTSTVVPAGSFGATGIGCHTLAVRVPNRNPLPPTHMGGEGGTWIGMAPFTATSHMFQNLGDGTYNHSGSLAIRAAVQAQAHITYKILYNDAVAMTGGQPVEGEQTVGRVAAQVLAEGVSRVVVVSDQVKRFRRTHDLPSGVSAYPREELDSVQRLLRDTPGVTVLIYDQTCAAEKRRRRKRGSYPDPDRRVFINDRVCEGCGDCSVQSNCLAIQPLETELGRKRTIDQSACNKDESCTRGFCPSFVTVEGARLRPPRVNPPQKLLDYLPEPDAPQRARQDQCDILIAGIGGTGVLTLSAVLGMAAHLEGRAVQTYDMTGLAQKGGAVFSHVRLTSNAEPLGPAAIPMGAADVLLACDAVAATQKEALLTLGEQRTAIVVNADISATSRFQADPDLKFAEQPLVEILTQATGGVAPAVLPAAKLAVQRLGDAIATNMVVLGFAWQRGLIPLSRAALERAIEINNVAVSLNLGAFSLGRAAAVTAGRDLLTATDAAQDDELAPDLNAFIERRIRDLTAYWNRGYAERYRQMVEEVRSRELALGVAGEELAWAVARAAYKLMAYKDEYEIARLYTDGRFRAELDARLEPGFKLNFHFAPPLLTRLDPNTRRPRKITLGNWMTPFLGVLARLKWLRETPLDLFAHSEERRLDRRLRDRYLEFVRATCSSLTRDSRAELVDLALRPLGVRGFGVVREPAATALLATLTAMRSRSSAAQ
jgi:indolepyruvate ferredoxin oxidoreductase